LALLAVKAPSLKTGSLKRLVVALGQTRPLPFMTFWKSRANWSGFRGAAVVGTEAAHVDDLAHAGGGSRLAEVAGRVRVLALEVGVVEGVHQVDRDVDAVERRDQRPGVHDVGSDRLARAVVLLGAARHRADGVPVVDEGGDEAATDEAGGPGDQDGGHGHSLARGWGMEGSRHWFNLQL